MKNNVPILKLSHGKAENLTVQSNRRTFYATSTDDHHRPGACHSFACILQQVGGIHTPAGAAGSGWGGQGQRDTCRTNVHSRGARRSPGQL